VNLLGAHVDYSEGWVMPAAIHRAVWVAAGPNTRSQLDVEALDLDDHRVVDIDPPARPVALDSRSPSWVDYPRGVAWALREKGLWPGGMNAVFGGDLPRGVGVSSSAAVEMAFLLAWEEISGFEIEKVEKAQVGVLTENAYLGVQSGIMDQFASLFGRSHHVLCIDCRSLTHETVPVPDHLVLVVTDTQVKRRLVDSNFNDRRAECAEAVDRLRSDFPELQTLRDLPLESVEVVDTLPEPFGRRARHVVEECARVHQGLEALRRGDLARFSGAVRGSHVSSRDLYDVSIPELDRLAEIAWEFEGCHGARLTGAGFGGCVVAVVERDGAEELVEQQRRGYLESFGSEPVSFVSEFAAGAGLIDL